MGTPKAMMQQRPVKLACRNVWKLFGPGAERFLKEQAGTPGLAEIQAAGLTGAVRAAYIDRKRGVQGKSVSVRVKIGGRRCSNKHNNATHYHTPVIHSTNE